MGARNIKRQADNTNRNIQAEDAAVRQQMWGTSETGEDEEMGDQTVLGDIFMAQQPKQQSNGSGLGKLLLATAMGAAVPTAGVMWLASEYLPPLIEKLGDRPPAIQPVKPGDEPDVEFGLGKLEDYFPNGLPE